MSMCPKCGKPLNMCEGHSNLGDIDIGKFNKENVQSYMTDNSFYEHNQPIIPGNLSAKDGEIPVKQYNIAILRSRLKFMRAEGRMQVTNKRVIFRATGRSLRGKTVLQKEFSVDEIAGIEIKKDFRFNVLELIFMLLFTYLPIILSAAIVGYLWEGVWFFATLIALGIAVFTPIFILSHSKNYFRNILLTSASFGALLAFSQQMKVSNYSSGGHAFLSGIFMIIAVVFVIAALVFIYLQCFKPNLSIDIKTKAGTDSISINPAKKGLLSGLIQDKSCGYNEVFEFEDTDLAIKELGALIADIQNLGDFAIEKWKKQ